MKSTDRLNNWRRLSVLTLACCCLHGTLSANQQDTDTPYRTVAAIKTNLLSDAFWTPSLSLELGLNDHWTLDFTGEYNNWDAWDNQKWRHWTFQPELRYWFQESFNHWFVGIHGLGGEYNVGNLKHQLPFFSGKLKELDKYRYQGSFIGGGIGLGYAWQWSKHWGMSAELGMGYMNMKADKFECEGCEKKLEEDLNHHYFGPTKAALNLIYRFTQDKPQPVIEEIEPVPVPDRPELTPNYVYVRPVAEVVKTRALEGQAFIEFEVNKTDIQPNRANNKTELGKIIASIDSVRNNPDNTISQLSIKGFASPDGPYDKNVILAKGRTEELSRYVNKLYKFDRGTITTSYEAEDWEGLRRLVDASTLPHRKEILDIIDNDKLTLDQKEVRIKKFADDYDMMRGDILMRLRHSDYVIKYVIRSYTSPEEIREVLNTRPGNLSLAEFYTAAEGYTEGTEYFNQVFLTAVQFYPSDETANLNAANTHMAEGNLPQARRHLERAGQSKEAIYARGIYNALTGNYEEALSLLHQAQDSGIEEAARLIDQVEQQYEWEKTWGSEQGK